MVQQYPRRAKDLESPDRNNCNRFFETGPFLGSISPLTPNVVIKCITILKFRLFILSLSTFLMLKTAPKATRPDFYFFDMFFLLKGGPSWTFILWMNKN